MSRQESVKKRIMFYKGEDFYFLTYNIVLILHSLQCYCGKRVFKDFRKLAFLIEFIANRNLALTLKQNRHILNPVDRDLFTRAYADGLLKLNHIIRLLHALEKQDIVILERDANKNEINVCLVERELVTKFVDKELFRVELENLAIFKTSVPRSNTMTLETMLNRLFDNHGIKTWNDF